MAEPANAFSVVTSDWDPAAAVRRFAHDAMATTFEVFILGEEGDYARQAAEAAFDELGRLELELSRFIETSDVSRISGLDAGGSARVGIAAFECIELASRVHAETGGAFDVTVGALEELWGAAEGEPSEEELAGARDRTGIRLIETSDEHHTVGVRVAGLRLDLGGIGKGYALDRMAELLHDWSIERALVHSGESSVVAMGSPPGGDAWSLELRDPADDARTIGTFRLRGSRSLSGSGRLLHGSHILDPRTGRPAEAALGAWAAAPSAALADALSTAFMVMSTAEVAEYCAEHADVSGMVMSAVEGDRPPMVFGECDEWLPLPGRIAARGRGNAPSTSDDVQLRRCVDVHQPERLGHSAAGADDERLARVAGAERDIDEDANEETINVLQGGQVNYDRLRSAPEQFLAERGELRAILERELLTRDDEPHLGGGYRLQTTGVRICLTRASVRFPVERHFRDPADGPRS